MTPTAAASTVKCWNRWGVSWRLNEESVLVIEGQLVAICVWEGNRRCNGRVRYRYRLCLASSTITKEEERGMRGREGRKAEGPCSPDVLAQNAPGYITLCYNKELTR